MSTIDTATARSVSEDIRAQVLIANGMAERIMCGDHIEPDYIHDLKRYCFGPECSNSVIDGVRISASHTEGGDVEISVVHPLVCKTPVVVGRITQDSVDSILRSRDSIKIPRWVPSEMKDFIRTAPLDAASLVLIDGEISPLMIQIAILNMYYQASGEGLESVAASLNDAVHLVIGENRRTVADAGVYIPDSAKERAAERALREARSKIIETDEVKSVDSYFKSIASLLKSIRMKSFKIYKNSAKDGVPTHPKLIRLAVAIMRNPGWEIIQKESYLKRGFGLEQHDHLRELSVAIEAFVSICEPTTYSDASVTELTQAVVVKAKALADSVENSQNLNSSNHDIYQKNIYARILNVIKTTSDHFSKFDDEIGEQEILDLTGAVIGWGVSAAADRAAAAARKDNPIQKARNRDSARILAPDFVREGPNSLAEEIDSAEKMCAVFGIEGFQFGKSMPDDERLELLKRTASALQDLSEILGIAPDQIGLRGGLRIALGARGSAQQPVAHYEPRHNVINFARKNGFDGSCAHEWMHALDYANGGKSILMPDSEDFLEDPDIREAVTRLVNSIYTGTPSDFIENRMRDIEFWKSIKKDLNVTLDSVGEERLKELRELKERREVINSDSLIMHRANLSKEELEEASKQIALEKSALVRDFGLMEMRYAPKIAAINSQINFADRCIKNLRKAIKIASRPGRRVLPGHYASIAPLPHDYLEQFVDTDQAHNWTPSEFAWRASEYASLEPPKKRDYWVKPQEMLARLFEVYIQTKMKNEGRRNNMLVEVADYRSGLFSAYPNLVETPELMESLDNFITVLRTKKYF